VPTDPTQTPPHNPTALLAKLQSRLDSLYSHSSALQWSVRPEQFQSAVERSVRKRFANSAATEAVLSDYLDTLHLNDLALANACLQGSEPAWDHFVRTYRPYLRASAAAMLKGGRSGTDPQELADSLFAELYGLVEERRAESSLLRYFHGRSSLRTWLRTVLAQRFVDRLRQSRRWEPLTAYEDAGGQPALSKSIAQTPPDPYRALYLQHFLYALRFCVAALDEKDRKRLELYYAREKTLAEIGRLLGEHESSVSRNLERIRKELRQGVESALRTGSSPDSSNNFQPMRPMSEEQIALCFEYAGEDSPIDFRQLFPDKPLGQRDSGRKESV
jgi:RNA polymerase sigma factor (sigma-70 family)